MDDRIQYDFHKKEVLDYFLSKEADHFWIYGMTYKAVRINETTLEVGQDFEQLVKRNKNLFTRKEVDEEGKPFLRPFAPSPVKK